MVLLARAPAVLAVVTVTVVESNSRVRFRSSRCPTTTRRHGCSQGFQGRLPVSELEQTLKQAQPSFEATADRRWRQRVGDQPSPNSGDDGKRVGAAGQENHQAMPVVMAGSATH